MIHLWKSGKWRLIFVLTVIFFFLGSLGKDTSVIDSVMIVPQYYIRVSTSPYDLNPQPSGEGYYYSGTTATISAPEVNGYSFQQWVEYLGDVEFNPTRSIVSTSASYSFMVTGYRNLIAEYLPVYSISVSTIPSGLSPQPSGGGSYFGGNTASVIAQAVKCYSFDQWLESGEIRSTSSYYSFEVFRNVNLVAMYSPIYYDIAFSTSPPGLTPQPAGGGNYPCGQIVTGNAQTVQGYTFQRWMEYTTTRTTFSSSAVSTSSSYSFPADKNRNLVAEYLKNWLVTLSTNPSGLNPQPRGGATYLDGQTVTVEALSVTGYTFQRWTENGNPVTSNNIYSFAINNDKNLVAEYSRNQYSISVSISPQGLNPQPTGGDIYGYGDTAYLAAQSVTGYTFKNWSENRNIVSTSASFSFTVTGNRSIEAGYERNLFPVSVSTIPTGLTPKPKGEGNYWYGDSATVTKQDVAGYTFQRWTENGTEVSRDPSYSFQVFDRVNMVAEYSKNKYTVSISTSPSDIDPQPVGQGTYFHGDALTVNAPSVTGYTFQRWTENGKDVTTRASYSFMVSENRDLIAEYSIHYYNMSVSMLPAGLPSPPEGSGIYKYGQTVTANAKSIPGYKFQRWTENGQQVSLDSSFEFTITKNISLVAEYLQVSEAQISLEPESGSSGDTITVKGTGFNIYGEQSPFATLFFNNDPIGEPVPIEKESTTLGSFSTTFIVPQNITPGIYRITARGPRDSAPLMDFEVEPPISWNIILITFAIISSLAIIMKYFHYPGKVPPKFQLKTRGGIVGKYELDPNKYKINLKVRGGILRKTEKP